jgi:hypothetical protein
MKTRTDLLNHLVEKYNLQRYLEIGVQNTAQNFDKINCNYKICVDPDPAANATYSVTSDYFFDLMKTGNKLDQGQYFGAKPLFKFDLIFIDGLHTAEQVKKDFENALTALSPNGFIVLHDCNPLKEEHTIVPRPTKTGHWNGDVYKFAQKLGSLHPSNYCTVDIDNGCGVYRSGEYDCRPFWELHTWTYFEKNRKKLLNLITWDEFISLNPHV